MIAPGDKFAGGVQATLEEMETGGAIVIVVKIVFAGPQKLDWHADLLGDGRGFVHVIVGEATTESAAGALQVHDDVVVGDIQHFGDKQTAIFWRLTGRDSFLATWQHARGRDRSRQLRRFSRQTGGLWKRLRRCGA